MQRVGWVVMAVGDAVRRGDGVGVVALSQCLCPTGRREQGDMSRAAARPVGGDGADAGVGGDDHEASPAPDLFGGGSGGGVQVAPSDCPVWQEERGSFPVRRR